jgi:hypothetical protein
MGRNMTFRISTWLFPLVLTALTPVLVVAADKLPDKSWILPYQTNEIQFVRPGSAWTAATPGRHPFWVQTLINRFLAWQPLDSTPTPTGDCDLYKLRESIRTESDNRLQTQIMNQFRSKCPQLFTVGSSFSLVQGLQIFSMKYDIDQNPFFHRVVFQLPDGEKLKGVLAIRDTKRRPLVIVRAGITGNVEEAFAERFFFYQFFERGLFNVLLVENMTGTDYIHYNHSMNFGGIAESYQNIWLAKTLTSPRQPISQFIQSLHLVGLSLGGQGVLTAAWLARYQSNPHLFSSFMAFCPLVNTVETFDYLFQKSWMRYPLEIWAHSRFGELKKFQPELFKKYWGLPRRVLGAIEKNYKRSDASVLGVTEPWFISRRTDYLSLHELSKWDPTLRDPVWIWMTEHDSVVPPNLNTDRLQLLTPLRIPEGNHCSFPVVWDGRLMSAALEGYILGAAKFTMPEKEVKIAANPVLKWKIGDIKIQDGNPMIQVTLITDDRDFRNIQINRNELDFQFRETKLTEHEKFMIQRWISSNLHWKADAQSSGLVVSWPTLDAAQTPGK